MEMLGGQEAPVGPEQTKKRHRGGAFGEKPKAAAKPKGAGKAKAKATATAAGGRGTARIVLLATLTSEQRERVKHGHLRAVQAYAVARNATVMQSSNN